MLVMRATEMVSGASYFARLAEINLFASVICFIILFILTEGGREGGRERGREGEKLVQYTYIRGVIDDI